MALFEGLSAFPITPADQSGRVDVAAVRRLVRRLVEAEVDSIGLLGSTGSYAYLSREERRRTVETAVEAAAGGPPVMVGIGALRTDAAIDFGHDAKAAGADAVLMAPISYLPLTEDEVFAHFEAVAGAVGLPLCIYDNPAATHFSFTPGLIARLARVPNIEAVKLPPPVDAPVAGHLDALKPLVPADFSVGYSTDWRGAEAMLAGSAAWYSVLGGLFPELCMAIRRAAAAGDEHEVSSLNHRLEPLWALFKAHSSYRVIHYAADLMGLSDHAPPAPILPLAPSVQTEIAAVVAKLGLDAGCDHR